MNRISTKDGSKNRGTSGHGGDGWYRTQQRFPVAQLSRGLAPERGREHHLLSPCWAVRPLCVSFWFFSSSICFWQLSTCNLCPGGKQPFLAGREDLQLFQVSESQAERIRDKEQASVGLRDGPVRRGTRKDGDANQ